MTTKHSNYNEMRGFADEAVCRVRSDYSEKAQVILQLAVMVMGLTDDIKQRQATEDNLRKLLKEVADCYVGYLEGRVHPILVSEELIAEINEEAAK